MLRYLEDLKEFKYWGKIYRKMWIRDMIWNLIFMLIGIGLYIWLNNTGLLIYLILMNKIHWFYTEEES